MTRAIPWWIWLIAVAVSLYAAYNPSGVSVYHLWVNGHDGIPLPVRLLVTLALLVLIALWCRAAWLSLGLVGLAVLAGVVGLAFWIAVDLGADPRAGLAPHVLPQIVLALILTFGLRWAPIWRRMTGRVAVDDPDTHG